MAEAFELKKPSTKKIAIKRIKGWLAEQPTIKSAKGHLSNVVRPPITHPIVYEPITEGDIIISKSETQYVYA